MTGGATTRVCATSRGCLLAAALFVLAASATDPIAAAGPEIDARVRSAYPGVLKLWAAGDSVGALEALSTLETGLVREKKAVRDIEEMWRSKLAVIRDTMARAGVEVLVPIMLLHHDAGRHYSSAGEVLLANHSRVMSAELAEFYAKKSEAPASRRHAADLLVSLAGHLQEGLVVRRSASLYYQALELYKGSLAAHLGLASMFERRGELESALEHYGEAARVAPEQPEPALRHALVASRLGEREIALDGLERVLAMETPDWLRRVALQEKAKLSPIEVGERVARTAANEFPDSSRQAIQIAFLLERQRRPNEALVALDGLPARAEAESERYYYTRWPREALDEARERLRRFAGEQNEVLQTAAVGTSAAGTTGG